MYAVEVQLLLLVVKYRRSPSIGQYVPKRPRDDTIYTVVAQDEDDAIINCYS